MTFMTGLMMTLSQYDGRKAWMCKAAMLNLMGPQDIHLRHPIHSAYLDEALIVQDA